VFAAKIDKQSERSKKTAHGLLGPTVASHRLIYRLKRCVRDSRRRVSSTAPQKPTETR